MGRGKWKPRRGGPQRFSSVHDPDAYVRGPRRTEDDSSSGEDDANPKESGSGSGSASEQSESGSESSFEEASPLDKDMSKLEIAEKPAQPVKRELTRREREAIEKEQARQHYLRMKQKEDAARLATIKKRREEEAAAHAAAQKAKEEAMFRRR